VVPFSVRVTRELGVSRVVVAGELDLASSPVLERNLRRAERLRPALIVLDLRGLTFIDLTGLSVVLEADRRAKARGGELALAHAPRVVSRLVGLFGLDAVLRFISDRAATQSEPPARSPAPR
jgi:anti-sigma B factor antagonist